MESPTHTIHDLVLVTPFKELLQKTLAAYGFRGSRTAFTAWYIDESVFRPGADSAVVTAETRSFS